MRDTRAMPPAAVRTLTVAPVPWSKESRRGYNGSAHARPLRCLLRPAPPSGAWPPPLSPPGCFWRAKRWRSRSPRRPSRRSASSHRRSRPLPHCPAPARDRARHRLLRYRRFRSRRFPRPTPIRRRGRCRPRRRPRTPRRSPTRRRCRAHPGTPAPLRVLRRYGRTRGRRRRTPCVRRPIDPTAPAGEVEPRAGRDVEDRLHREAIAIAARRPSAGCGECWSATASAWCEFRRFDGASSSCESGQADADRCRATRWRAAWTCRRAGSRPRSAAPSAPCVRPTGTARRAPAGLRTPTGEPVRSWTPWVSR